MTNKFVSFLKKAGEIIVDAAGIYAGVGPLLTGIIPAGSKAATVETQVGDTLTGVASIVITVESAFAAVSAAPTGALKLQAAAPLVAQLIQQSALVAGKKIAQPALMNQGVVELTQGVVDILNSLESAASQSTASADGTASLSSTGAIAAPAAIVPSVLTVTPVSVETVPAAAAPPATS